MPAGCRLTRHPTVAQWRWLVLIGAHVCLIFSDGIPNCTGVLLVHWKQQFRSSSTAELSMVLSIQLTAYHFAGAVAGAAAHKIGCRKVVLISGATSFIAIILASLAPSPLMLYLTAGLLAGAGFGSILNALVVVIAQYFHEYYGIAQSLSSAGSAVGIVLLPPLTQYLATEYSWRGAYLILAGLAGNILVCGMLLRPVDSMPRGTARDRLPTGADVVELREPLKDDPTTTLREPLKDDPTTTLRETLKDDPTTAIHSGDDHGDVDNAKVDATGKPGEILPNGDLLDGGKTSCLTLWRMRLKKFGETSGFIFLFTHYRFAHIVAVIFFLSLGFSAVMNHLVLSVIDRGIAEQAASFLMSFFGIGSIIGKLISAFVLGKKMMKVMLLFAICNVGWGLSVMLLRVPHEYGWFIVVALLIGIFSGINICTAPIVIKTIVGPEKLGRAFGVLMFAAGLSCLVGPLLSGVIYDLTGSFDIPFYLFGALMMLSGLSLFFVGKLKRRDERRHRGRGFRQVAEDSPNAPEIGNNGPNDHSAAMPDKEDNDPEENVIKLLPGSKDDLNHSESLV